MQKTHRNTKHCNNNKHKMQHGIQEIGRKKIPKTRTHTHTDEIKAHEWQTDKKSVCIGEKLKMMRQQCRPMTMTACQFYYIYFFVP